MISVSISVDVPNLADAVRFYASAFGFSKSSEPVPGVVVLHAGKAEICLLEKRAGSNASSYTRETRHYERHWTPVHLDIHADDLKAALAQALDAGATREQVFENPEHGSVAFCSDPFGHGFCLIERKRQPGSHMQVTDSVNDRRSVPDGWHTVTPRIVAQDSRRLVEFLMHVFGATGEFQDDRPSVVWIGDSAVMVSEAGIRGPMPAFLYVYVSDADATYRVAIAAGARALEEPFDTPYEDRRCMVEDEWGNTWQVATHAKGHSAA